MLQPFGQSGWLTRVHHMHREARCMQVDQVFLEQIKVVSILKQERFNLKYSFGRYLYLHFSGSAFLGKKWNPDFLISNIRR